jgi:hypothetical protein
MDSLSSNHRDDQQSKSVGIEWLQGGDDEFGDFDMPDGSLKPNTSK